MARIGGTGRFVRNNGSLLTRDANQFIHVRRKRPVNCFCNCGASNIVRGRGSLRTCLSRGYGKGTTGSGRNTDVGPNSLGFISISKGKIVGSSSGASLNGPRPSIAVNLALDTRCGKFSFSMAACNTFNTRMTHS